MKRRNPDRILTRRERQVLALTLQGKNSHEIGRSLRLNPRTVESHRQRLGTKLGATQHETLSTLLLRRAMKWIRAHGQLKKFLDALDP